MADIDGGRIVAQLTLDNSQFNKEVKKSESTLKKTAARVKEIGRDLTFSVSAPLIIATRSMLKAFNAFETGLVGVAKTTGATGKQIVVLRKEFQELSKQIPVATTELLKIGVVAGQSGIAIDKLSGFVETSARFAASTGIEYKEAARSLALFASRTNTPVDQLENLASVLVELGNKTIATEEDILHFVQPLTVTGRLAGLAAEDLAALAATLFVSGIGAEKAGTVFQKFFIRVSEALSRGGPELQNLADISRKTKEQFVQDWEKDAAPAFIDFLKSIGDSRHQLAIIGELIPGGNIRDIEAFAKLVNKSDEFATSLRLSRAEMERGLANIEESTAAFDTFANSVEKLTNHFNVFQTNIVQEFEPALKEIVDTIIGFVERVEKPLVGFLRALSDDTKKAIVVLTGLAIAFGPVAFGIAAFTGAMVSFAPILASGTALWSGLAGKALLSGKNIATVGLRVSGAGRLFEALFITLGKVAGPLGFVAVIALVGDLIGEWLDLNNAVRHQKPLDAMSKDIEDFLKANPSKKDITNTPLFQAPVLLPWQSFVSFLSTSLEKLKSAADEMAPSLLKLIITEDLKEGLEVVTDWQDSLDASALGQFSAGLRVMATDVGVVAREFAIAQAKLDPLMARIFDPSTRSDTLLGPLGFTNEQKNPREGSRIKLTGSINELRDTQLAKLKKQTDTAGFDSITADFNVFRAALDKLDKNIIDLEHLDNAIAEVAASTENLRDVRADIAVNKFTTGLESQLAILNEIDPVQAAIAQMTYELSDAYEQAHGNLEGFDAALNATLPTMEKFAEKQQEIASRINVGGLFVDNLTSALDGFVRGTRDFDLFEILKDTAVSTFTEMFAQMLKEKLGFDKFFVNNFQDFLPGVIKDFAKDASNILSTLFGAIFGGFGNIFGGLFGGGGGGVISKGLSGFVFDEPLATGGITRGPTLATVGDNASGTEAIIPLERFDEVFGSTGGGAVNVQIINNAGADVSVAQVLEDERGKTIRIAVQSAVNEVANQFEGGGRVLNSYRAGPLGRTGR